MEELISELDRLKKDYLESERLHEEERACLLRIIGAFGTVIDGHTELQDSYRSIKALLEHERALPLAELSEEIARFRNKVFSREVEGGPQEDTGATDKERERFLRACRMIRKIMLPILENFYPVPREMKLRADAIVVRCDAETTDDALEEQTESFLAYVRGLRNKVSEDFRYINRTFLTFLEEIKDLEKMLVDEYGSPERLKEIDYFEMNVNKEVGAIVSSFDVHATIGEIRGAVVEKINNIKNLVAARRLAEEKRAEITRQRVIKLNEGMKEAETRARAISKKTEQLQAAAMRDGPTGLFNRTAFDMRLRKALKRFSEDGKAFLLVFFDVDRFEWINDTFGHVAGDKVLRVAAQSLRQAFGKGDFLARYGGDEFVALIEGTDEGRARERIRVFREIFGKKRFFSHAKEIDLRFSVSTGTAAVRPGDSFESLIQRVDSAMYRQRKGRKQESP